MPRERNTNYRKRSRDIAYKCRDSNRRLFLIAAEGDKTEANYFTRFETKYKETFDERNLHVEFIDKETSAHSDPKHVYETLKNFCEELEKTYDLQTYDELWLITDTDDYDNRENAISELIKKCEEDPLYHLSLSNPCFEIWAMLHFADLDDDVRSYDITHSENCTIKDYVKSFPVKRRPKKCKTLLASVHGNKQPIYENMIRRIKDAIPRAKKLKSCIPLDKDSICTDVYKLMEKLI